MTNTEMTDTDIDTRTRPEPIDFASDIIASGIADMPVANLVETAMERLVAAGVPLARMHVGFRILHPLFDGMSISWTDEAGVDVAYFENLDADNSVYRLSPFYFMLSNQRTEFRARLDRDACVDNYPLLVQLRDGGHTDYLALIVAFGTAPLHPESHDGLGTTWATKDPGGFTDDHVCAMRQVLAPLALALRVVIKDQITRNALNTFHGPLVGGRILSGTIKRGDGERLAAALWYSDLRNSTALADQLSVEGFLDLLNVYFDCAAGAVIEQGGQVLDIVGDAILAFFPADEVGEEAACGAALRVAVSAQSRLAAMKADGCARAAEIDFGIGVHFGDVVFGNAGTAERLKFGVIGRAVNEVARNQDMSKLLGQPIVVSDTVADRAGTGQSYRLQSLGMHVRGMPTARRLWALRT
ncbi:MAG: adenylate/guanylate cyclase domain-containing protein [Methyloceanibacter sp.]|uniref:adenylate/guanylate cyclase domain-containing protein n=1 Tax=Methyloceanibacter sp. TaxID=1965321 RepID=UPI003EDEA21C